MNSLRLDVREARARLKDLDGIRLYHQEESQLGPWPIRKPSWTSMSWKVQLSILMAILTLGFGALFPSWFDSWVYGAFVMLFFSGPSKEISSIDFSPWESLQMPSRASLLVARCLRSLRTHGLYALFYGTFFILKLDSVDVAWNDSIGLLALVTLLPTLNALRTMASHVSSRLEGNRVMDIFLAVAALISLILPAMIIAPATTLTDFLHDVPPVSFWSTLAFFLFIGGWSLRFSVRHIDAIDAEDVGESAGELETGHSSMGETEVGRITSGKTEDRRLRSTTAKGLYAARWRLQWDQVWNKGSSIQGAGRWGMRAFLIAAGFFGPLLAVYGVISVEASSIGLVLPLIVMILTPKFGVADVSPHLHLLGVNYREQVLQNVRARLLLAALPVLLVTSTVAIILGDHLEARFAMVLLVVGFLVAGAAVEFVKCWWVIELALLLVVPLGILVGWITDFSFEASAMLRVAMILLSLSGVGILVGWASFREAFWVESELE